MTPNKRILKKGSIDNGKTLKNIFKKIYSFIIKSLKKLFIFFISFLRLFWYIFQRAFLLIFLMGLTISLAWWLSQSPSNFRDWTPSESILSQVSFSGNIVEVKDVRNFTHSTTLGSIPGYYDDTYDITKIESLYYIIEPFSEYDGPAHTMLSFGFEGGKYVTVSAEIRKEKGESFSPLAGLMNQFEMVYIIGSEHDLLKLRTNIREDTVRMYPMNATKDQIQDLFLSVMHRADKLSKEPEFYNTFWNTCTTSILKHVNTLRTNKIDQFNIDILLPSNSDKIAYNLGLINTTLPLVEARNYYKINELSQLYLEDENYSILIRKDIK